MVTTSRVSVAQSAILLHLNERRCRIAIRNRGTGIVSIGASGVTSATGFDLDPGDVFSTDADPNDAFYGIAATGTHPLHVLISEID